MDCAISPLKTAPQICVSKPKLGFRPIPMVSLPIQENHRVWRIKCAKESDKTWIDKEVKELIGMKKKWSEKCKEGGIVEMMECLEREAIMGEDEGREAIDYNRRALIFDKSAKVFQALKQQTTP